MIEALLTDHCFEHRIFGTAIAISSFFNLLVPGATSLSPTLVIIVRVCQGFVEVSDM
jgi:ACS family sodium-dependent inorganic phosphate cotransporter-like MFS transporter 6/7/8